MKRKYFLPILFIIMCCLLSFMEISCLAKNPVDYGGVWNLSSKYEKENYLIGLRDGMTKATLAWVDRLAPYLSKKDESRLASKKFFTEYTEYIDFLSSNSTTIINIVTDLYKTRRILTYISRTCLALLAKN